MTMRGEFKTPGGKLVAVEFGIRDKLLRDVVVTGDFFLYPEEALPRLAASLEGAAVTESAAEYARRVQEAIAGEIELLGTSPEGIAIAVLRALEEQNGG